MLALISALFEAFMVLWLLVPLGIYLVIGLIIAGVNDNSSETPVAELSVITVLFMGVVYGIARWQDIHLPVPAFGDLMSFAACYLAVGVVVAFTRWYLYCVKAAEFVLQKGGDRLNYDFRALQYNSVTGQLTPTVAAKYKVANWLLFWPFYFVLTVFGDILTTVRDIAAELVNKTVGVTAKMVSRRIPLPAKSVKS